MKALHLLISVLIFPFVLGCASKKEEEAVVITEPIRPQTSITLIIQNEPGNSLMISVRGVNGEAQTSRARNDTIKIYTEKSRLLHVEKSRLNWLNVLVPLNDTLYVKNGNEDFQVVIDQERKMDLASDALVDSLSKIKFAGIDTLRAKFREKYFDSWVKNIDSDKGVDTITFYKKITKNIIENKSEFRMLFDLEMELYQYQVQLLDSLHALSQVRESSLEYAKAQRYFAIISSALYNYKSSSDPYFENYFLSHLNDDLLQVKNDYGLLDTFLANIIYSYILKGQGETKGNTVMFDYEKALQEMPTYFSGELLKKLNAVAITRLTEQNPDIDLFKDLAQNVKLDSVSKALLTRQIEDMMGAERLRNLSKDTLYLTSLDNDLYSFERILDSSETELILIDLWASWCGPCFRQFSATEELEKEYSGKLSVVYISIDDYKSKWLQGVDRAGLKGRNSFLSVHPRKSKILTVEWKVTAIPRFILMDKEGRILSENTPAPDAKEMRALINQNIAND